MKKVLMRMLSLLLVVTICMSTFGLTAFATYVSDLSAPPLTLEQSADENAGTVTVTVKTNAAFTFMGASATIKYDKTAFSLTTSAITGANGLSLTKNVNADDGATVAITTDADVEFETGDTFLTFVFTKVDGIADGDYSFVLDVTGWTNSNYGSDTFSNSNTNTVTYTVGSTEVTDSYTATLSSTAATVTNGETVSVTVTVGGTATDYNAAEMTLSYPTDILDYTSVSTTSDELNVDSNTDGKLYIVDKGQTNDSGMTYTFNFTATKAGTGNVTLDSALFGTRLESQTGNLTEATVANSPLSVTVNTKTFAVTFPADSIVTGGYLFETELTPTEGTDFVFTAANDNYTYTDVVVKVGDSADTATEISGVTGDQTNGWTVPGTSITGNLYVAATATPKSYGVSYSYEDANGTTQSGSTADATYGANYTYTMPDGVTASDVTDGFHYEVDTVTINGTASDKYSQNLTNKTVIVTGTAITGEVVITLKKVTDEADSWAVAVESDEGITASEYSVASSVKRGETIALTIIPADGYTYTVTAKNTDDGAVVQLNQNDNVWTTVNSVTENITFVITRSVDTSSFNVETYLEGGMGDSGDQNMYLVMIGSNLTDQHYTCNGNAMFWSEKYSANCYLVISTGTPTADNLTFTIVDGAATAVSYDMDVNESTDDTVDANDAQLAYDMYNKEYNVDTENVTIWKFLKADVNGDKKLDTTDAANIVNAVLTRMKSGT